MEYMKIIFKVFFFYFFIASAYRIIGKREVGQLGIMDLIVSILIAELAAIGIQENSRSIFMSIIPISFLVIFQILIAHLSLKLSTLRYLFEGKPSLIVNRGQLNFKEMVKQRYNLDDLLLQLREKGIKSIEEVDYAFLESNGKLSTFLNKKGEHISSFPMPLILDGEIQHTTLKMIKKNQKWLNDLLVENSVNLEQVFYAFYKGDSTYIIKKKDL